MSKIVISSLVITMVSACSWSLEESLEKSRLEIVDPTPDGDFSDAYFRDTLTGETCERKSPGKIGC